MDTQGAGDQGANSVIQCETERDSTGSGIVEASSSLLPDVTFSTKVRTHLPNKRL